LLFALMIGQAIAAAQGGELRLPLGASPAWLAAAGALIMSAGLGLLLASQLQLGTSWRIGIEEEARPGLKTDGLYRFSRNPIFLALYLFLIGYALLLPTTMSFVLLLAFGFGVRQQVRDEEQYLLRAYGEAYGDYARRVGPFRPGIG